MTAASQTISDEQLQGIIVVGIDDHEMLNARIASLSTMEFGYTPPIYLVETDISRARDSAIALGLGSSTQFHGFFGPNAGRELISSLSSRMNKIILPTRIESCGTHDPHLNDWISKEIAALWNEQGRRIADWNQKIAERAASRDAFYWKKRFQTFREGASANILIVTTRYSSYMQHACKDLSESLELLGHRVTVLEEPDTHTMMSPQLSIKTHLDLDPDIVITTNYPRATRPELFPTGCVSVCWIQDAMPHLFRPLPTEPESTDFIAGHLYRNAKAVQAYGERNQLEFPVPVSTQKFHPEPVPEELQDRYTCDIAYISHQSQPAQAYHEDFIVQFPVGMHDHLHAMRNRLEDIVRRWDSSLVGADLKSFNHDMAVGIEELDGSRIQHQLWNQYTHPMLERLIRHQTLEWAAEIAEANRLELRIYGKGWEKHPTLSQFAKGELPHGEALRAAYQCSGVQLHASPLGCGHQRVGECFLSGGLMLARRSWDEFYRDNTHRMHAFRSQSPEPDACLLTNRQPGYSLRYHPELRSIIEQRMHIPSPTIGWDHEQLGDIVYAQPEVVDRLQPWLLNYDGDEHRPLHLLDDALVLTFSTRQELESAVLRAINDQNWREARAVGTRSRITNSISMNRFAESLISMMCDQLSLHSGPVLTGAAL